MCYDYYVKSEGFKYELIHKDKNCNARLGKLHVFGKDVDTPVFMPKVVLMQFFSDFLVMYNKADKNTCELIYYEDVVSWHYAWSANRDYLYIELKDGQTERIEAFSKTIFEYNMNRFLKAKHKKSK